MFSLLHLNWNWAKICGATSLENSTKCCPLMERQDCMSVALRDRVVACEHFSFKERKAVTRGADPSAGPHPHFKWQIMLYFYLLKATFPASARCNVSPCTSGTWFCHERIAGMPELKHTGKKKRKVDTLNVMLGVGFCRKWFSAGEYNGLWWRHAKIFTNTQCV